MEGKGREASWCSENGIIGRKRRFLCDYNRWYGQRGDLILLQWRVYKQDKIFIILPSKQEENPSLFGFKKLKRLHWNCMNHFYSMFLKNSLFSLQWIL